MEKLKQVKINEELNSKLNSMNDAELDDYILIVICSHTIANDETDVIEIIHECSTLIKTFKEYTTLSATRFFSVIEIIINQLKDVAKDGGIVEITRSYQEKK